MICIDDSFEKSWINQAYSWYPQLVAARKTDTGRGGYRKGSGRKPIFESRARVTFDLESADLEALTDLADQRAVSLSQLLRDTVKALLRRKRK